MNRLQLIVSILALTAASAAAAHAAEGDYTLYEPKPTTSSRPPANPEDGLLVRNIVIKRGDTLWKLASKYRSKGSYFPQFLLVNKITDPDLIYTGRIIHVPVTPGEPQPAVASKHLHRTRVKKIPQAASHPPENAPAHTVRPELHREAPAAALPPAYTTPRGLSNDESEQQLFEVASREYKMGDCRKALERIDQFLDRYPSSPLAADVSLYKADCYMKLSGQ